MPELPEVETVRRGLENLIIDRIISGATTDNLKSFPNATSDIKAFMIGAEIKNIKRRGKLLLINLSSGYTLATHLKMTGQLVFDGDERFGAGHPTDSLLGALPDKSTRVIIEFTDGAKLFFNDQRKFGWMKLLPTQLVPELPFMKKIGPEPLDESFKANDFIERIRKRNKTIIKAAILDQTVLAGVGNIYADEALWQAKIHPETRVYDLTDAQLAILLVAIKQIMQLAIDKGGSSSRNYVNAEGVRGSYLDFANVFRREGQPCRRHPSKLIEKIRVAGRGTHICLVCQVPPLESA